MKVKWYLKIYVENKFLVFFIFISSFILTVFFDFFILSSWRIESDNYLINALFFIFRGFLSVGIGFFYFYVCSLLFNFVENLFRESNDKNEK
jgi:hypothetical protein